MYPLQRCSIYDNKAAGERLAKMLEMAQSRSWPEALKVVTGQYKMDACGMSLSSFLVSVAADHAKEVVAEHEILTLAPRDWEAFLAALDDTDRPRPRLAVAARRYRSRRYRQEASR